MVSIMRIAALAAFAMAVPLIPAQTTQKPLNIPIQEYKLDNGLRIVMSEDHSAPTYCIAIAYDVGSHNERAGRTGFAHLFEHMMFQGSENVAQGRAHSILIADNGGDHERHHRPRTVRIYFESLAGQPAGPGAVPGSRTGCGRWR